MTINHLVAGEEAQPLECESLADVHLDDALVNEEDGVLLRRYTIRFHFNRHLL